MRTKQILQVFTIILTFAGFNTGFSQNIYWSRQIGSNSWDYGRGITDKQGAFFILGGFDGPWCYLTTDTLINNGQNSLFFTKYDINGNELWAQRLGGDNSASWADFQGGSIFYDSISNFIFLVGGFWGPAIFGTFQLFSQGIDIFIAKYDLDGNCIWAKSYGGAGFDDCSGISFDKIGNIFICGVTNNVAYFDSIQVQPGGFLAKLDQYGNCIWAKHEVNYAPTFYSMLRFMDIKIICNSDIIVAGCTGWDGVIQIDTITISHPGLYSSMICCFDGNGNVKWVREGISKITEMNSQIGLDSADNIYFTGHFIDSIDFNNNTLVSNTGNHEMFLVKYDKNGNYKWAKKADASMAQGSTVVSDPKGNVYVTGYFSGFAGFDGFNITSYSDNDMFLARYSTNGDCMGVMQAGNCKGWGVTQDKEGNPFVVIRFMNTITIGSDTFTSHGLEDILIFKCSALTGINEKQAQRNNQLYIYSNPSNGKCNIVLPKELLHEDNLEMKIYDGSGKLINNSTLALSSDKIVINFPELAHGTYYVIIGKGQKFYSGKIIFN